MIEAKDEARMIPTQQLQRRIIFKIRLEGAKKLPEFAKETADEHLQPADVGVELGVGIEPTISPTSCAYLIFQ